MTVFSGRYLLNFLSCYFSMFSPHGQVHLMMVTFVVELVNMVVWEGKKYWSCRSTNFYYDFLHHALVLFLTNLIISFGFGEADSMMLVNLFRVPKIWDNTLLCLKGKWPCLRTTLHAPKMCAIVQMVLLHWKQEASEEILQRLSLISDGKVSKVEERQKEMRLTGDASKDLQEKFCWM